MRFWRPFLGSLYVPCLPRVLAIKTIMNPFSPHLVCRPTSRLGRRRDKHRASLVFHSVCEPRGLPSSPASSPSLSSSRFPSGLLFWLPVLLRQLIFVCFVFLTSLYLGYRLSDPNLEHWTQWFSLSQEAPY